MLKDVIKSEYMVMLDNLVEDELERNGDEYIIGMDDCGCINNGVGFVTCDKQPEYDMDMVNEVVQGRVIESIRNGDTNGYLYDLVVNSDKVRNAFADFLEGL